MSNMSSIVVTCANAGKCVIVAGGTRATVDTVIAVRAIAAIPMVSGIPSQHSAQAQSSAVP